MWPEKALDALLRLLRRLGLTLRVPDGVPRMIPRAYIYGPRQIQRLDQEGSSLLSEIFVRRPEGCRYAVVSVPDGEVWVIDMFTCGYDSKTHTVFLGNYTRFTDVDAAIMATMMEMRDE